MTTGRINQVTTLARIVW